MKSSPLKVPLSNTGCLSGRKTSRSYGAQEKLGIRLCPSICRRSHQCQCETPWCQSDLTGEFRNQKNSENHKNLRLSTCKRLDAKPSPEGCSAWRVTPKTVVGAVWGCVGCRWGQSQGCDGSLGECLGCAGMGTGQEQPLHL